MNKYTCFVCADDFDEDDTVWANREGNIEQPTYAYCVPCLPGQKENYDE
jgi:hypothetical protein